MKKKLSGRFWLALTLFSLIGQVAWVIENMYFNVFMYEMFNATAADISMMVAASAIAATLTTVFMGPLSDRIGKRKLFMCGGYILWGISIFSFTLLRVDIIEKIFPMTVSAASLGVTLTIVLDCVMTFFGSTANDAAFNAWLTDSTDDSNRGAAEGINAMMPLVAILVVFGGFMFFDLSKPSSWTLIYIIIGAVVILIGILGIFLIKDPDIQPTKTGYFYNIFYGFRPSTIKKNVPLYLILIVFAIFNISIQIFMPYLILYYEKSLGMANYVLIMAPAIIVASVVTAFWGKVYDKKGFKFSALISIGWLALGYIILFFTSTTVPVFIGSLLMMSGYLSGMAVFGASIRDYTPVGKAGMFQGLRIFSQVLVPGVIGPAIGAAVLKNAEKVINNDGTESFLPNANIFLAALVAAAVLLPVLFFVFTKVKTKTEKLETPFEEELKKKLAADEQGIPWEEYPRPQFKRDSYICLNGKWDFKILRKGKMKYDGEILVPFPVESRLSGVEVNVDKKDVLVYTRNFDIPNNFKKDKIMLHFGAVDQVCNVFVNGKAVGSHVGGYIPFSFDITEFCQETGNVLSVEVTDPLDIELPYGKQCKKRGGMWYTPVSGIWQTVWLESITNDAIESIKITPTQKDVLIEVSGGCESKKIIFEGKEIPFEGNFVKLFPECPVAWTPDNPKLYDFEIISGEDSVKSYFALRTVEISGNNILLNGKPYFFNGLLDQGYYSDGIFLPATSKGFEFDILTMKNLGFNMLRKHIKIEPMLFYYYCDKYGMVVFQDLVNSGKYNFIIDTAWPTIGKKSGIKHSASAYRRENFEKTATETLSLLYNCPCVCYYTLFNEGWGQYDAARLYKKFKSIDSTRIWDATSGWFQTGESDVLSEHIYFKPLKFKQDNRPLVLSEFGGYSLGIKDHIFNPSNAYGYKFFNEQSKFEEAMEALYLNEVVPAVKNNGLCAIVLTQVSDVEDETNGLVTYDRQVIKIDRDKMNRLSKAVYEAFDSCHG